MKYKLRKKRFFTELGILIGLIVCIVGVYLWLNASRIHFVKGPYEVEINSVVDFSKFVESVDEANIDELKIDIEKVNMKKLGKYTVTYKIDDEEESIDVHVIDSQPPKVELKEIKVAVNQNVKAEDVIKEIKDSTKTEAQFKKDYSFSKAGKQKVIVLVKDEADNETEVETTIEVVEDKKAPQIIGDYFSVPYGKEVDLKEYISVKDDYDSSPEFIIEKGDFNVNNAGEYKIKCTAKDFSGNKSEKTVTVKVLGKDEKEKVVYLTFDDGPSKYTPEVLEILDKYNAKATFFITGMNKNYRKYIGIANDKGHTIGLHTYSHEYSQVYKSTNDYFDDLEKIGNLAKEYIGYVPKYIRFPGGGSNTISRNYSKGIMTKLTKMVEDKGYIYYDWNAENGDGYSKMSKSEMIRRGTSSQQNEVMILMHDANGKQATVDTLPQIIEYYQKRGYVFKAIDDKTFVPHQRVNN